MLNIINAIIDISKIESGLIEIVVEKSNINEQLEYIFGFFKPEVEKKGMQLVLSNKLPVNEELVETDREKLFAILINLVKNAIKYSNKGKIEFGCINKGEFIEFYVKDNGSGISPDRLEAIFERFIQADIYDKNAAQGAGLGLSIAKAYVKMLGGNIWVRSEEGKGSEFYFTLPNKAAKNEKLAQRKVESGHGNGVLNKKLKILIAEDDEASGVLIQIILRAYSSEILISKNGLEALEICKNNRDIDLIMMDVKMPVMDGFEATRHIRQFNKDVIIIAQTAYGLSGDKDKALLAGCSDYISKPIIKEELLGLINKYFTARKINIENI